MLKKQKKKLFSSKNYNLRLLAYIDDLLAFVNGFIQKYEKLNFFV